MKQSLNSALFVLLGSPLASAATHSTRSPQTADQVDEAKVTWILEGPDGGHYSSTQTFVPTTYTEFASLTTTLVTNTIITARDSTTTRVSTYNYRIGPNGVGWSIPSTTQNGATIPLPVPTYLPGQEPVEWSNFGKTRRQQRQQREAKRHVPQQAQ